MEDVTKKTFIEYCGLSNRTRNILHRNSDLFGIHYLDDPLKKIRVEDLSKVKYQDLKGLRGAGATSLQEIVELCSRTGVSLKEETEKPEQILEDRKITKDSFIRNCGLSTRARNVLYTNSSSFGVPYNDSSISKLRVSDIGKLSLTELQNLRGGGAVTLKEILELCARTGVEIKEAWIKQDPQLKS